MEVIFSLGWLAFSLRSQLCSYCRTFLLSCFCDSSTRDHSGSEGMSWFRQLIVIWQFWLSKFNNVYIQSFFRAFSGPSSHSFCANSTHFSNEEVGVHDGLQYIGLKTIVHSFFLVWGIGWFIVNWVQKEPMCWLLHTLIYITRCDLLTLSFDVTEFVIFQQYFGDL